MTRLLAYFLRLGTIGFGGPIALAGAMQRDLVEQRGWFTRDEYLRGLALAQLAPGPLAAQLAMYLGWLRGGSGGAALVGIAFVLPSLVMVLAISIVYTRAGAEMSAWLAAAFYGIGAAVIAVIARSAWKLVRLTLVRDVVLWVVFLANAIVTALTQREIVTLILVSGAAVMLARMRARPVLSVPLLEIAWFFTKAGAFIFGSGLAIVPFLYGGIVRDFGWLNERQFLDAVAVAMITPGPVVITVAFIGYLVAGLPGALVAALAVFLPCYLFVVGPAPFYERIAGSRNVVAFVDGITAAATGAIAGACIVLAQRALIDLTTLAIFAAALALLTFVRRIPEPLVILGARVVGVWTAAT
ncbi:MAG TPA: chromate efflux transporter [Thermoanaerobaculia bacterium]|nr:chromate efflux transporter [Thermoanaerobaculia bacterium]